MTIILENIRSAWNVGSIFRSCDALGFDLILVGYTPYPNDANLKLISKTAIGAEKTVNWQHFDHSQDVFHKYEDNIHIAIEISDHSQCIYGYLKNLKANSISQKDLFIWFGNEIHGVSQTTIANCKNTLYLPMHGSKESLNVSSCMCTVGYLFNFGFSD